MASKEILKVKDNVKELFNLASGFSFLGKMDVLVGIPQEANADHGGVTNADLLYIHTNGSPARGIPARPTIQPAVHEPAVRARLQGMFRNAFLMAITGNRAGAQRVYSQIGMIGANAAKAKFGAVGPPLKAATIKAKGSSAPLIDTGALRNAVTYVVRKK